MPKTKGKNPGKMCQLIFLKIYTHNNRNNDMKILNFIFKTSQYPWMKVVINERFFQLSSFVALVSLVLYKSAFKVLKKTICGENLYFWVSKRAFQLAIFQYLKNRFSNIFKNHWPYYGIIIESFKCWKNKNRQIYRN